MTYFEAKARAMDLWADAYEIEADAARIDPFEPEKAEERERCWRELAASYRANARTYREMAERETVSGRGV
jgi:hypothetical protein